MKFDYEALACFPCAWPPQVIQAIVLSSLAGMAREAQTLYTAVDPKDFVGTSATLFAISLAQSLL